jgi:hypothetical protein
MGRSAGTKELQQPKGLSFFPRGFVVPFPVLVC